MLETMPIQEKAQVQPVPASSKAEDPTTAAAAKSSGEAREEKQPDKDDVIELAANVKQNLKVIHDVDLQFSVHDASGQIMVTVREEATGEVIREIPPSEILNLAAKFDDMVGLLLDQKG